MLQQMGSQWIICRVAVILAVYYTYLVISPQVLAFHLTFGHRLFRSIQQNQDFQNEAQLYHPINPNPQLNPASTLIRPIECRNANNHSEVGICMFSIDCMQNKGVPLSICKHNYFVGTCCRLPNYNNFVGIVYDLRDTENQNVQLEARKAISLAALTTTSETVTNEPPVVSKQPNELSSGNSASEIVSSFHEPIAKLANNSFSNQIHQQDGPKLSNGDAAAQQQQATTLTVPTDVTANRYIISSTSLFATNAQVSPQYQTVASQTFQSGTSTLQQQTQPTTTSLPIESPRNADGMVVLGPEQPNGQQQGNIVSKLTAGELVDSFQIQRKPNHPNEPIKAEGQSQELLSSALTTTNEQATNASRGFNQEESSTRVATNTAPEVISSAHSALIPTVVLASMNSTDRQKQHSDLIYQVSGSPSSSIEMNIASDTNLDSTSSSNTSLLDPGLSMNGTDSKHTSNGFSVSYPDRYQSTSFATSPTQEFVSTSSPSNSNHTPIQTLLDATVVTTTISANSSPSQVIELHTNHSLSGLVDLVSSTSEQLQTTTPFTSSLSTASLPIVNSKPYSPTQAPLEAVSQVLVSSTSSETVALPSTSHDSNPSSKQPSDISSSESLAAFSQLYSSQHSATSTTVSSTTPSQRLPTIIASRPFLNGQHHFQHLSSGMPLLQAASKIVAGPTTNHLIPGLGGLQSAILAHIPFKLANGLSSGLSSYLQAAMKPTGSRPLLSSNTAPALQYQQQANNSSSRNPIQSHTSVSSSSLASGIRFPIESNVGATNFDPLSSTTTTTTSTQLPLQAAHDQIREAQLVCGRPQVSQSPPLTLEANNQAPAEIGSSTSVIKRRIGRIVGGNQSWFGQWPWMVSLRQWRKGAFLHKCGAALLNENWAITAAHCVENVKASDLLLRLGEFDVSKHDEPYPYVERRVKTVVSHPSFDPKTFEYDLALLRFTEPIQYERNIIPVCVPNGNDSYVDRMATVIGWGRLYEDGPLPDVIQHVNVPIITNNECEKMYKNAGYIEEIPDMFICAGINKGGRDSCEGDSGGPLTMVDHDGRSYLVGIISWGIGCALPSQPGVYTRITAFSSWINDQMMMTTPLISNQLP